MRWFFNLVKAVLALLVLLGGVSLLLPSQRQVVRTVDIRATPAEVWPWIAEPRKWTGWSPWLAKDPQTRLQYEGPIGGEGAGWTWSSRSQGHGHMRFVKAEPPQRLGFEMVFDDTGMKATGDFTLTAVGAHTRVQWRMTAELGANPLARWFGLGLDALVGPDFEAGLASLANQVPSQQTAPAATTPP